MPVLQFDDRLSTLLSAQPSSDASRAALWSQLIDLLAQGAGRADLDIAGRARALSGGVSPERRLATAKAIAARTRNPDLVRIFGADAPRIAAPVMLGANLSPAEWQQVIPALAPHARALLRQRRDLPREAHEALLGFGHSDFAIAAVSAREDEVSGDNTQIRDLMARIADWREQRATVPPAGVSEPAAGDQFRFEVDGSGTVNWCDSSNRAALIGLSLSETHQMRDFGFDAHASGAFAKRTAFRHARLTLPEARMWSVAGDPVFRASDGRFLGYRCVARPLAPAAIPEALPAAGDAFRQLAHELRTPLNAVHGFAAMIEAQLLGPVSHAHRRRAVDIGIDATRLLSVIDDFDGWGRDVETDGHTLDLAGVLASVSNSCQPIERERDAHLHFRVGSRLPAIAVGTATTTRLIHALARVALSAAGAGERVLCEVRASHMVSISFAKPAALTRIAADDLVSGSEDRASEDILPLGLGFTLRMVKAQARAAGGTLDLGGDALVLRLPVANDSAVGASERQ